MKDLALSVVIPVRNMAGHIGPCVEALASDLGPHDEIVVVDDGSSDATSREAQTAGARVVPNRGEPGPYGARNYGVANSDRLAIVFIDGRCRALAGLLDAHRSLLSRSSVALSCTDVEVVKTTTLAGRIARSQDAFRVAKRLRGHPLDFYPTANLGVHRSVFQAVGGFRHIRSGADADFCWRVRESGLGTIAGDDRTLMRWSPRGTLKGLIEQNYRYGRSFVYLERLHAPLIASAAQVAAPTQAATRTPDDRAAAMGAKLLNLVARAGRVVGKDEHRHVRPEATAHSGSSPSISESADVAASS